MASGVSPQAPVEEESYLVSVSDLMIGLLFLFIIVLMAFALNFRSAEQQAQTVQQSLAEARDAVAQQRDALTAERDALTGQRNRLEEEVASLVEQQRRLASVAQTLLERDATRGRMLERVQEDLRARAVEVAVEPENGVLRLPEQLLFQSAEATLRPEGERVLRELASVLVALLPCYSAAPPAAQHECPSEARPLLEAVLIEGHTDDRPIGTSGIQDNWTLAALRGANTFKALTRFEPELDRLKNDRGQALIGVGSYEARRPVSTLDTPEARRLNRRIDLRFIVAAPSASSLTTMQHRLQKAGRTAP